MSPGQIGFCQLQPEPLAKLWAVVSLDHAEREWRLLPSPQHKLRAAPGIHGLGVLGVGPAGTDVNEGVDVVALTIWTPNMNSVDLEKGARIQCRRPPEPWLYMALSGWPHEPVSPQGSLDTRQTHGDALSSELH